jgi:hypothetical protein
MPKRTTGGAGKRMPMNMRTTQGLRAKIDKAAAKSGRSLVQEVEHRVEQSFTRDWTLAQIESMIDGMRQREQMLHSLVGRITSRLDKQLFADFVQDNGAGVPHG